ncbi:hypothetical protein AB0I77_05805 [Streptomyces sp. NPDC050619]|uniref:hypothetical protein n=1 Tax=Streptomyces sp. NPDC050619 TaxID=3157214 RepID=UPI00343567C1
MRTIYGLPHQDMGPAFGLVSTSHELGAALGVAVNSTIAEGEPGGRRRGRDGRTGGSDDAFTECAIIAALVAAGALLPAERPDPA